MKILSTYFSLLFISMLHLSCIKQQPINSKFDKSNADTTYATTLKFTTGIRAIFQDSQGRYWFGSLREGVAVYDGTSFTYFTVEDGLTDNQIYHIQEDQEGVIWFDTQKGVSSYDGQSIKSYNNENKSFSNPLSPLQSQGILQGKWQKTGNELWFGAGIQEGVYRYDGQQMTYLPFPPHKKLNLIDNLFAVTCISKGQNNMIWLGTYAGVFGYDGKDFTIINDDTLGYDRIIEQLHIRSMLEDSKGRLWLGNNGIGVLLRQGNLITNFSEANNLIHPTSKRNGDKSPRNTMEHVFTIAEDSKGNIWFGDRDAGIWKYNGELMTNYSLKDGISNDFALSIFEDNTGNLWFGMADGTVYIFDGNRFESAF